MAEFLAEEDVGLRMIFPHAPKLEGYGGLNDAEFLEFRTELAHAALG